MTEEKPVKITLTLSHQEFKKIQEFRSLYLLSGVGLHVIPQLTDFIDTILLFTDTETYSDKNVARGFFNRLAHRKNKPEFIEPSQDNVAEKFSGIHVPHIVLPGSFEFPEGILEGGNTTKFIYSVNSSIKENLRSIRETMIKVSGKKLWESLTDQDIIRESLLFVLGRPINALIFFASTYIGRIYGLDLITSLELTQAVDMHDDNIDALSAEFFTTVNLNKLRNICLDQAIIKKFIDGLSETGKNEFALSYKEYKKIRSASQAHTPDLNLLVALQGFTLAVVCIKTGIYDPPTLIFYPYPIKEVSMKKPFVTYLQEILQFSLKSTTR